MAERCITPGPTGHRKGRCGLMTVHTLEWKRTDHGITDTKPITAASTPLADARPMRERLILRVSQGQRGSPGMSQTGTLSGLS